MPPKKKKTVRETVIGNLSGDWTDEQVAAAYDAEAAAQRSVINVPARWPASLTDALTRRVQAFLDNGSTSRVGRNAPGVRELEKNHDRVPGTLPEPTQERN